ncbi:iridovirus major capsid protein [Acanthamoeba castellanii str. Neff]|uniref:Iridovirus major capsid protein n=1 Tax=Acanthamoeba castellanii (strain ATCC 30010 / Neff) TaxID=1257118 RepID=L8GG15_ACACF|nr:iridovirus major capsid protein [Acanthamoeba castellanii str. Neff]ELR11814.1 iridovirus major capsid protein [Acanthamoeba castellanii str. Neff]
MTDHILSSASHHYNNVINDSAVSLVDMLRSSSSSAGAVPGAAAAAQGGGDKVAKILSEGYKSNLFRLRFCKVGDFMMSSHNQAFNEGEVAFGGTATCTLKRLGHMIYHTYLVIDLPGIKAARRAAGAGTGDCSLDYPSEYPVEGEILKRADEKAFARYAAERTGKAATARAGKKIYNAEAYGSNKGVGDAATSFDPVEQSILGFDRSFEQSRPVDKKSSSRSPEKRVRGWVRWCNAIGQYLPEMTTMIVEDKNWNSLINLWLYGWEEVAGYAGKELNEHIGKRENWKQLVLDSADRQRLYTPLPFFYTLCAGCVFPYGQMNKHNASSVVKIEVKFAALNRCIVTSGHDIVPVKADGHRLTAKDLAAHLRVTYVHLNENDARTFTNGNQILVITRVQHNIVTLPRGQQRVDVPVPLGGPLISLMWMLRRKASVEQNSHFNFAGVNGRDPLLSNVFYVDNKPLFGEGDEARVYRMLEPLQSFRKTPKGYIYVKSFACDGTAVVPNGMLSLKDRRAFMRLILQQALVAEEVEFIMMGRSFDVAVFDNHHPSLLGDDVVCQA